MKPNCEGSRCCKFLEETVVSLLRRRGSDEAAEKCNLRALAARWRMETVFVALERRAAQVEEKEESNFCNTNDSELNLELDRVMRENNDLKMEVESLRQEVALLGGGGDKVREQSVPSITFGTDNSASGTKRNTDDLITLLGDDDDDLDREVDISNQKSSTSSGDGDNAESESASAAVADAEKRKKDEEIARLIKVQESLIREVVLRGSEMAVAESQILEVQKELDGHKEECYGHMKVIQELRGTKMQLELAVQGQSKPVSCEKLLNLKLELVQAKRDLAKSEAAVAKLKAEKSALVNEYDRMRADVGHLMGRDISAKQAKTGQTNVTDLIGPESLTELASKPTSTTSTGKMARAAAKHCPCLETVDQLRRELFQKDFCLERQVAYCNDNHVDVAVISDRLGAGPTTIQYEEQSHTPSVERY